MHLHTKFLALALLMGSGVAMADLEPWKDYEESESVWSVTTIAWHPTWMTPTSRD